MHTNELPPESTEIHFKNTKNAYGGQQSTSAGNNKYRKGLINRQKSNEWCACLITVSLYRNPWKTAIR